MTPPLHQHLLGLLLGTAVGDSLGLPLEGLSPRRAQRLFPPPLRQRLLPATGLLSDDTEHTIMVAQALLAAPADPERFIRHLAWQLRLWLLALPAGVGLATARAILKLLIGLSPHRSGVYSAGNGPAMRIAIIGAFHAAHPPQMERFVSAATRITHRDPRALTGARAVARITARLTTGEWQQRPPLPALLAELRSCGDDAEWLALLQRLEEGVKTHWSVARFAVALGAEGGISGYIYRTVPLCIYAWYHHFGDFRATLEATIGCGGDSDTTGAIAGALAGCTVGEAGIPAQWLAQLREWPRGQRLLRQLADALTAAAPTAAGRAAAPTRPVRYAWWAVPARNLIFLAVVLLHGVRRLLPPY